MDKNNDLVNRIISAIQAEYVSLVGIEKIKEYKFVPLRVKDGDLFITIDMESDKDLVAGYMKSILPYPIKFIMIPNSDFVEILDYILEHKTMYNVKTTLSEIINKENQRLQNQYLSEIINKGNQKLKNQYLSFYLKISIILLLFPPVCRQLAHDMISRADFPHNFSFLLSIPNHYSIDLPVLLIELLILVAVIGMCYLSKCKKL